MSPIPPTDMSDKGGHFAFSSADHDAASAFDEYRRLYAQGADVHRAAGEFSADVQGWRLDGVLMFERRLSGVGHAREGRVAWDEFDHIVLYAVLKGELIGSPESGFVRAGPGDIILLDTRRPSRTEAPGTHYLTLSIARHLVEAIVDDVSNLHGTVLHPPGTRMLTDYLVSLARWARELDPATMPSMTPILMDLLATALSGKARRGTETRREDMLRRQQVERYITEHLGDRSLSTAIISRDTGISRSSLYRLLDRQGGVAHLIQTRRIDSLRCALEAGSTASFADLALTYGFASEAHMSRVFTEQNGIAPGAYRRQVQLLDSDDVGTAQRRWKGWMTELV